MVIIELKVTFFIRFISILTGNVIYETDPQEVDGSLKSW